jgi:hypothetical protein
MLRIANRARWTIAGAVAIGAMSLTACDPKQELLDPQQPGVISPTDVQNATGAEGLYIGTLGRLRAVLNGGNNNQEQLWAFEGLMTDEFKSGDTFSQRNDADQRQTQNNDGVLTPIYRAGQQTRGRARDAINALTQYEPDQKAKIAEMYMVMGFMEEQIAQAFCNGIPFGETVGGIPQYTAPITNKDAYTLAITRFDSALALLPAAEKNVRYATLIAKGRAQVNLGQYAAAAATVAAVPTDYQYVITYSQTSGQDNEWWQMQQNTKRYTVGDSADATGRVKNSLPFVSAHDPRVPTTEGIKSFDNITPYFQNAIWLSREDPIAMVAGLDARLIETEAKLQNDIPGMMTALNDLRAAPPTVGKFTAAAMPALAIPASQAEAVALFFQEKAFWQFGRGERLSDMRRMIRAYGMTEDNVFPTGAFHKTGTYGTGVNFPVPDDEKSNPLFTGCIDRNA